MSGEYEQNNGTYCGQSIKDVLRPLLIVFCTSGTVCSFFCAVAIIAMVLFRLFNLLTHRLILYTLVSIFFFSLASVFQFSGLSLNFWEGEHNGLCVLNGFLQEYSIWVMLLSTLMMTLHLTVIVLFPSYYENVAKLEPFYLLFPWLFPLLVSCIPFVNHNYGVAGSWCWIRLYNESCSLNKEGVVEMYAVWYGELIVGLILNNIALVIIGLTLCKRAYIRNTTSLAYRKALKQTLPLLAYPITYQILSIFAFANRSYLAMTNGKYNKWLFYAHAVTAPSWGIFAPIFTIIYFMFLCRVIKENVRQWCCFRHSQKHVIVKRNRKTNKENRTDTAKLIDPYNLTQYGVTITCSTTDHFKRESEVHGNEDCDNYY